MTGRSPSGRAAAATQSNPQAVSSKADIPSALALRFCKDCRHISRRALTELCEHPASYQGGDFDLVTGDDNRRFRSCFEMRLNLEGRCGRSAVLYDNKGWFSSSIERVPPDDPAPEGIAQ